MKKKRYYFKKAEPIKKKKQIKSKSLRQKQQKPKMEKGERMKVFTELRNRKKIELIGIIRSLIDALMMKSCPLFYFANFGEITFLCPKGISEKADRGCKNIKQNAKKCWLQYILNKHEPKVCLHCGKTIKNSI